MASSPSATFVPRTKSHLVLAGESIQAAWRSMMHLPLGLANPTVTVWLLLIVFAGDIGSELEIEPFFVVLGLLALSLTVGARGAAAQSLAAQIPARIVRPVVAPKLLERIGLKEHRGARRGSPEPAPPPTRKRLWTLSGGLFPAAVGLLALRLVLMGAAYALLIAGPVSLLDSLDSNFWQIAWQLPLAPIILLGLGYILVVDCSVHLALNSLAANRRGAGSAMQHAWRLATGDVPSMAKSASLHLLALAGPILVGLLGYETIFDQEAMPAALVAIASGAFLSNILSHYWARAYQRMGGIHTAQPARVRGRGPNPGAQSQFG